MRPPLSQLVLLLAVGVVAKQYPIVFKEKDVWGCSNAEVHEANKHMDALHSCADDVYGEQMTGVEDAMEANDWALAAKRFLVMARDQTKAIGQAEINARGCACVSRFVDKSPTCGDLGELKGNLSLAMPYCDITARCPSTNLVPILDMAAACYNESYDSLCGEGSASHPCLVATEPIFETAYLKSVLDCADAQANSFPFAGFLEPLGTKVSGFLDYKSWVHNVARRPDKAIAYADFHDIFCKVYNITKDVKQDDLPKVEKGASCETDKAARIKGQGASHNAVACYTALLDGVPEPDVDMAFRVFVDQNDTQPKVDYMLDVYENIYHKNPKYISGACTCVRDALHAWPTCDYFQFGYNLLKEVDDVCTVVDRCSNIDPQLFIDVGRNCRFGQRAKDEKDDIIDSLCNPDKGGKKCADTVERIFAEHTLQDVLSCVYRSTIDFEKYVENAPSFAGLPDGLNITNLLKQILENDSLLQYSTFTNFGCALLYKPDEDDEDYSYDGSDAGSHKSQYSDSADPREDNSKLFLAGAALLAVGVVGFAKIRADRTNTIVSAADDIEEYDDEEEDEIARIKRAHYGEPRSNGGLVEQDDEEI